MTKNIEDKYKELSELDHILQRPGMYIGSIREEESDRFIYNHKKGKMDLTTLNYIPGMLKVVDEVISNSCDEYRRKDNMGLDKIVVTIKNNKVISVRDNGGIPVVNTRKQVCMFLNLFLAVFVHQATMMTVRIEM